MKDLQNEIREAIENNLPMQVGKVLKQELATLAQLRADHTELKAQYKTVSERNTDLNNLKMRAENLDKKEAELRTQVAETADKKKGMKLEMAEKELELVKESRDQIHGLVNNLFRNIDFRRTIYGSVPMTDGQGYISTQNFNKDMDEKAD